MCLYFLLLDGRLFHEAIRPALAAAWQQRSFEPCLPLATRLGPAVRAFAERYHLGTEEPLLTQVARGLPFDRHFWTLLVGEALLYGAAEVPEFQTAPETLCCLLAPEHCREGEVPRERFAPIQQAHYGSRDLDFGGKLYRPEHAGYNDAVDVARLAAYLGGVDPGRWSAADLALLPALADEEERAEELEFVRDWFPALQDLYRRAETLGQIVVCEVLSSGRDF
jgi:hypothetical protein